MYVHYLLLAIPPLLLGFAAQQWVKRQFAAGSKVRTSSGLTGAQVSRRLLDSGGLNVGIELIGGQLTDHYDPRAKVMRLSQPVANSDSVAAVAVAAHETGHAFQDAKGDASFRLRSAMVPAVSLASQWWMGVFLLGVFAGSLGLIKIAAALFLAVVAFSIVTLPVEIGASRRQITRGLLPYQVARRRSLHPVVMLSTAVYPAYSPRAAAWSKAIAGTLLRHDLGFKGPTITDSLTTAAAVRRTGVSMLAVKSAKVGVDLLLITGPASTSRAAYAAVLREARSGAIRLASLKASYARILKLKSRF